MQRLASLAAAGALIFSAHASAQTLDPTLVAGFKWRTPGPANFMGRLSDVAAIPSPSKTIYVAAAGGGIWKSTNNGMTWKPTFDDKRIISMGMLAIAPSDTNQVWALKRRSTSAASSSIRETQTSFGSRRWDRRGCRAGIAVCTRQRMAAPPGTR